MFIAPDAISVTCLPEYILRVTFDNGEVRDFHAREQLFCHQGYQSLENPVLFQKAHINYGTVVWDENTDIAPEWLYSESKPISE